MKIVGKWIDPKQEHKSLSSIPSVTDLALVISKFMVFRLLSFIYHKQVYLSIPLLSYHCYNMLNQTLIESIFFLSSSLFLVVPSVQTSSSASSALDSFWTTGSLMPTARSEIAGAALNDKIYIIGGFDETGRSSSSVQVYDSSVGEWAITNTNTNTNTETVVAPLPEPLDHAAAASYNGKLYVVGGGYLNRGDLSNKLFIYDPNTNKWTEGKDIPSARGALTANFVNGTLYAVGGVDASGAVSDNWAYNPVTNIWTEKAPMPTAREHLTSTVVDDKLYVIGGRTSGMATNLDANEVYDPIADNWTVLESMPSQRGGLASAAVNGSIYVFGGEVPARTFDNNEKYDPASKEWRSELPMPTARHGLSAIAIDDVIHVIGGGPEPGGSGSNLNEIFHIR
ncbi:MAG TPA: kelch repeat-containing protein [Nitrososphaeraceae archaeon]|nr:kelch repeat-containing protein [Nitrososphaeraceae archaeon]